MVWQILNGLSEHDLFVFFWYCSFANEKLVLEYFEGVGLQKNM